MEFLKVFSWRFKKKLTFVYLLIRDREKERQRHGQREKQAPCRKPDVGLDPRTPGSSLSQVPVQMIHNRWDTQVSLFLIFYLREREREGEGERENMSARAGGGAERKEEADSLLSRNPDVGVSIPGPQNHDLSPQQMPNWLSHWGTCSESVLKSWGYILGLMLPICYRFQWYEEWFQYNLCKRPLSLACRLPKISNIIRT